MNIKATHKYIELLEQRIEDVLAQHTCWTEATPIGNGEEAWLECSCGLPYPCPTRITLTGR